MKNKDESKIILKKIGFFLLLVLTNAILTYSTDNINLENIPLERANLVKYSQAELDEIENIETTNPKRPYALGFVSESFIPITKLDERLQIKTQEFKAPNFKGKGYTYGFIMIIGKVTAEKLQSISDLGIQLLGYHSGHSYKAKMPLDKVNEIKDLPFVKWLGYSTSKQKIHPNLLNKISIVDQEVLANNLSLNEGIPVYINLFEDDTSEEFKEILERKNVKILNYSKQLFSYSAYIPVNSLKDVLSLDFVLFIEGKPEIKLLHDESMPSISADYLRSSTFGVGCTADSECNGIVAGTNNCRLDCQINQPPSNTTLIRPNGGETFDKQVLINWTISTDPNNDFVTYDLDYSNNSGSNWYSIIQNYGYENKLNDSSLNVTLNYAGNENKTVYLRIPKNSGVLSAKIDLTGFGQ